MHLHVLNVFNEINPPQHVRIITSNAAEILGATNKLGSLYVGKPANFFVTDGDSLDIRTKVERIYIQGRDIPLADKQTRLNDKYEQKYQQLNSFKTGAKP